MSLSRRAFLRTTAAGASALALAPLTLTGCDGGDPTSDPELVLGRTYRRAVDDDERIRRGAGIPGYVPVGVSGASGMRIPGLSNPGALVDSDRMQFDNRTGVESAATSGIGTEEDPYVIENLRLDNSEGTSNSSGLFFADTSETYWVLVRNCEVTNYSLAQVALSGTINLILENCLVYRGPDHAAPGVRASRSGSLTVRDSEIAGVTGSGILTATSNATGDITVENTLFSKRLYDETYRALNLGGADGGTVTIERCESVPEAVTNFLYYSVSKDLVLERCDVNGTTEDSVACATAPLSDRTYVSAYTSTLDLRYTLFRGGLKGYVHVTRNVGGLEVSHCTFEDNPAGYRQLIAYRQRNGLVHHCKFTKTSGPNSAENECCEFYAPDGSGGLVDCVMHDNWVTRCPEDAFEMVNPLVGCHAYNLVVDKGAGEIVDFFTRDVALAGQQRDHSVHHLYGDCQREAASNTNTDGVTYHDIYATCQYAVELIHQEAPDEGGPFTHGATPANCTIVEPMPPLSSCWGGTIVKVHTGAGPNTVRV